MTAFVVGILLLLRYGCASHEKQIYTGLEIWISPIVEGAVPNLIQ
jgi:hypothetical protein